MGSQLIHEIRSMGFHTPAFLNIFDETGCKWKIIEIRTLSKGVEFSIPPQGVGNPPNTTLCCIFPDVGDCPASGAKLKIRNIYLCTKFNYLSFANIPIKYIEKCRMSRTSRECILWFDQVLINRGFPQCKRVNFNSVLIQ